ncbi:MAG: hypothetical protein HKN54_00230 [Flavobacteriaceae bacterium]|nr:hypothetical protein [Flavobacteriaceae bacterium]
MQQFLTILAFYRPFVVWSFVINAVIGFLNPEFMPAIVTKLFLAVFLWYLVKVTSARKKLNFYKRLGISPFKLFSIVFLMDIILTMGFLVVFKEFT